MKLALEDVQSMMMCIALVAVVVFVAMVVDLVSGLYKAYLRGEMRRSEALKRTGYKFALYEGTILIAAGVDLLIHVAKMFLWFGWEMVYGLPLVTIALGIFWCVVEFLSVREKADEKTHSDMKKAEKLAIELLRMLEQAKQGHVPQPEPVKVKEPKELDPIDDSVL